MKYMLIIVAMFFLSHENVDNQFRYLEEKNNTTKVDTLKILNFEELEKYLSTKDNSKTYVVNFWATWCAPCVKELPYFEKLNTVYSKKNVEVILISLDFPKQIESKLKPFLKKEKLKSEVIVLNDVDSNTWIPKVDQNWSGAIPATIIYNKNKTLFYERSFEYEELEKELKQFLN